MKSFLQNTKVYFAFFTKIQNFNGCSVSVKAYKH